MILRRQRVRLRPFHSRICLRIITNRCEVDSHRNRFVLTFASEFCGLLMIRTTSWALLIFGAENFRHLRFRKHSVQIAMVSETVVNASQNYVSLSQPHLGPSLMLKLLPLFATVRLLFHPSAPSTSMTASYQYLIENVFHRLGRDESSRI